MFSKYFRARFASYKGYVAKAGKGKNVKCIDLQFVYDFDPKLAQQLGPRAESLQCMLLTDKDAALTARSTTLDLDTKTVQVRIQHSGGGGKGKVVLNIPMTRAISATAKAPTARTTLPSLEVKLTCELSTEVNNFAEDYLDEGCRVRLDRRQLELVAQGEPEDEEGDE